MFMIKRFIFLLLVSFSMLSDAFACESVVKAWEAEHYQGTPFEFDASGKSCDGSTTWTDKISSIKVDKDYVLRACEHEKSGGACLFVIGDVPKLADYRPTGINFNKSISSIEPEYQPRSQITIAAYYDRPDPKLGQTEYFSQFFSNFVSAYGQVGTLRRILHDSGLNVDVSAKYHGVEHADAKRLQETPSALHEFRSLYLDKKGDRHYGLYFPSKRPKDSTNGHDVNGIDARGDIHANWLGLSFRPWREDATDKNAHGAFLKDRGFGIVVPNAPKYVVAHQWGHMAGLDHVEVPDVIKVTPYGVGHFADFFGLTSFTTVMTGSYNPGSKTVTHSLFSSPKIQCKLPEFFGFDLNALCGKADESDARRALIETVLQWHRD